MLRMLILMALALLDGTGVELEVIMAITPAVSTGFTDSHFTRDAGIDNYGFDPIVIAEKEWSRIHGNDERISVENFRRGQRDMFAIISEVVYE